MSFLVLIKNYKAGELKLLLEDYLRECRHLSLLDLVGLHSWQYVVVAEQSF